MVVFVRRWLAIALFTLAAATASTVHATSVSFCVGDCDGNGMVTVDELIRGINIALGTLSVDECPVFDASGEGLVTVDEIVTAVANGLNGCPSIGPTPTPTPTIIPTITRTPTVAATVPPPSSVRVLATTGAPFGGSNAVVTSLGTPIISPEGFVVVTAELTEQSQPREALLRLSPDGEQTILLEGGQPIPNSGETVGSISQVNAKPSGVFVFVDAANGATLLRLVDSTITPVIGLGAPAARAGYESRMFSVPVAGSSIVADVFAPGGTRAVVSIPLNQTTAPIPIVTFGDTLSYQDNQGDPANGTAQAFDLVFAEDGAGVAHIELDPPGEAVLAFTFDENMLLDRHVPLVQGNEALGGPGPTFASFSDGVSIGGTTGSSVRGFLAGLSQSQFPGFSSSAVFFTNLNYDPFFVFQAGAPVPDANDATIDNPEPPAMGVEAAAVSYELVDNSENHYPALGFVNYQTRNFITVAVASEQAPGGGEFMSLPRSYAINTGGDLVFRAGLGGTESAYYAVSTIAPGEPLRRLVGTGDTVALPLSQGGGSATITALGMIPPTGGLGGEPTAVGSIHFTVNATLDEDTGAVLLVVIDD